jgi:hypothetical protein
MAETPYQEEEKQPHRLILPAAAPAEEQCGKPLSQYQTIQEMQGG